MLFDEELLKRLDSCLAIFFWMLFSGYGCVTVNRATSLAIFFWMLSSVLTLWKFQGTQRLAIFFWMLSWTVALTRLCTRCSMLAIFFWMLSAKPMHVCSENGSCYFLLNVVWRGSSQPQLSPRQGSCYFLLNVVILVHDASAQACTCLAIFFWMLSGRSSTTTSNAANALLFSFECCGFEEGGCRISNIMFFELAIFFWMLLGCRPPS